MFLRGLKRLGTAVGAALGVTIVISLLLGLLTGSGVARAISFGLYVDGVLLLVGCFVFGARGPLRGVSRQGETVSLIAASGVRRASGEERSESGRISLALFALGLVVVLVASLIDPRHTAF